MKTVLISSIVNLPAKALASVGRQSLIVFCLFTIFYLLFSILAAPAHAQPVEAKPTEECPENPSGQKKRDEFNRAAIDGDEYDSSVFNNDQMMASVDSLNNLLTGCSQLHPSTNVATGGTGALAASGKLVTSLYGSPPASGVQYFAGQIQKFNPVQPAYAQVPTGLGFDALSPVQKLWSAFRNMSYIGFVLVFIVIGFMVMFRSKISPQAVATVQDSLPRIVVALILVTFSYAIVGLMLDAMFVILNVVINILGTTGLITVPQANTAIFGKSIFGAIVGAWGQLVSTTAQAIGALIDKVVGLGSLGNLFSWGLGGVAGLIVGIAALFIMFRVFLMLLMAYVTIIILTIFAPFLLLFQALPGNNGAKEWFRQMAANIAVFPTVALMLILAGIIGGISAFGGSGLGIIGQGQAGQFPLFTGDIDPNAVGRLIGLGILFMTPGAAKMVKERFGVKEGAIGAGFAAGGAALGAGAGAFGRPFGAAINPVKQSLTYGYGHAMAERIGRFTGRTERIPAPSEEEVATTRHS